MKAQQFKYGLYNGYGSKLSESNEVSALITKDELDWLLEFARKNLKKGAQQLRINPNVIACITMERVVDEDHRTDIYCHCILITVDDYLFHTQPLKLVMPYFTPQDKKPPKNLNLLEVL
jgi:hypothetical protein